jgi:hypothetical protein
MLRLKPLEQGVGLPKFGLKRKNGNKLVFM